MSDIKHEKTLLDEGYSNIVSSGDNPLINLSLIENASPLGIIIEGTVLGEDNLPIKNALVGIANMNYETILSTVTDSNGKYLIHNIRYDSDYMIFASAEGKKLYQGGVIRLNQGEKKIINITLYNEPIYSNGIIYGIIFEDGTNYKLNNITVALYKIESSTETLCSLTTSNAFGKFIFTNLLKGDYIVKFLCEFYEVKSFTLSLTSSENKKYISTSLTPFSIYRLLKSYNNISGIVKNAVGSPSINSTVILLKNNIGSPLSIVSSSTTNSSGVYFFQNLEPGLYFVIDSEMNYASFSVPSEFYISSVSPGFLKFIISDSYKTFKENYSSYSQYLYSKQALPTSNIYVYEIYAIECSLTGYTKINSNIVLNLGGLRNGAITIKTSMLDTKIYDFVMFYVSPYTNLSIKIDVNGFQTDETYYFENTNSLNEVDCKVKVISLELSKGENTIKIYN